MNDRVLEWWNASHLPHHILNRANIRRGTTCTHSMCQHATYGFLLLFFCFYFLIVLLIFNIFLVFVSFIYIYLKHVVNLLIYYFYYLLSIIKGHYMLQDPMLRCLAVAAQSSHLSIVGFDLWSGAVIQGEEETFCDQASRSGLGVGCFVCWTSDLFVQWQIWGLYTHSSCHSGLLLHIGPMVQAIGVSWQLHVPRLELHVVIQCKREAFGEHASRSRFDVGCSVYCVLELLDLW